ncbi:MAG: tetratricopeptide repeat protein [Bacteroidota bacterium]
MQTNKKTKPNKNKTTVKTKPLDTKIKNRDKGFIDTLATKNTAPSWVIIFLLFLVFLLYGNTITNKYAFDDDLVTYKNNTIKKGLSGIAEIFTTHYANNPKQNYEYRPIVKLTFAIEYALFKDNPHVSHFINVLLYFLLCVILYLLLRKLLKSYHPWIPLLAVALFVAHPVHTEVVASLKNRDEILCLIGAFLSLHLFVKFVETRKWYWIPMALILLMLGYYSKASALVFLAIIPLTLYFFTDVKPRNLVIITALLLITIIVTRFLPHTFLPKANREILYFENPLFYEKGIMIRIGTALTVMLFYFKILLFPHPLLFYYGYNQIPVSGPGNIGAIISLLLCLAIFVVALMYFKRKHLLSFSILYFFICISQYTNIVKPPPGIVAERFLLAPSLGFCLALVVLVMMLFKINFQQKNLQLKYLKKPLWLLALIIIPYSIKTIARNSNWKDYETLYTHDMPYLENSAKANSLYAHFLYEKALQTKDQKKAYVFAAQSIKFFKRALEIYPKYTTCWNNLGVVYNKFYNDTTNSMNCFKQAIAQDSEYAEAVLNVGLVFERENHLDSAEYYFKRTLQLKKDNAAVYTHLGNIYFSQGNLQKAIQINESLMQALPTSDEPYINIGNYYLLKNDTINAVNMWEKAIEKQPGNQKLNSVLANYFQAKGLVQKAEFYNNLAMQKAKK